MNAMELQGRLKSFAYRIVQVCDSLPPKKISKIIEAQLMRSAFSAAANYRAACKAQSRKAFLAKLSIAFEEADESLFWLETIAELKLIAVAKLELVLTEADELARILAAARKKTQATTPKK